MQPGPEPAGMSNAEQAGTRVLLTGGTSGIGKAAAQQLAAEGATVGVVGRNRERGEAIERSDGPGSITFFQADLAEQAAVRSLASTVRSEFDGLDVLAHNAGVSQGTRTETPDGIEYTFAVNHLAPYLLTHELLALVREADGRIVVTASGIHSRGELDFDDLEYQSTEYDALDAYARSKLANVGFTIELADRLGAVTANCFHPGFVPSTELFRNARLRTRLLMRALSAVPGVGTSPETGAKRLVRLATDPSYGERSGCYVGGDGIEEPASTASDPDVRDRLWTVSAEYVAVDPDWPGELS